MIRHLVLLDDPLDPITDEHLYPASHDDGVREVRIHRERGVLPYAEIDIENPGWEIWRDDQPPAAAIVTSEDGTVATATVRARGWLKGLPDLDGDTVTLRLECYPKDYDNQRELAAAAVLGAHAEVTNEFTGALVTVDPTGEALPWRDPLWGRLQKAGDDVLQGRHAYWDWDPVTHVPTLRDHADFAEVLNLGAGYDPASLRRVPGTGPAKRIKLTVHFGLTTQSTGTCDIAPRVSALDTLSSYQAQAPRSMGANIGWSLGSPQFVESSFETGPLWTGRRWNAVLRKIKYVSTPSPSDPSQTIAATQYGRTYNLSHEAWVTLKGKTLRWLKWSCTWNYSQTRRETVFMTLECPCQTDKSLGVQEEFDMGEVTIGSLYTIDGIEASPLDETADYEAGDYVYEGGKVWKATAPVTGMYVLTTRRLRTTVTRKPEWLDTGITIPLPQADAVTFIELPRGLGSLAHGFRRMRAKALELMSSYEVEATWGMEDVPHVSFLSQIRCLLPGAVGEPMKPAKARPLKIVERLGGDGDTVTLTLAVPLGDGAVGQAREGVVSSYSTPDDYFGAGYVQATTPWYSAGPDVEWTLDADPLELPVDPRLLASPLYSVLDVGYQGDANTQLAEYQRAAYYGAVPGSTITEPQVSVLMRPLKTYRMIERVARANGTLLTRPRGLDLLGDGEP